MNEKQEKTGYTLSMVGNDGALGRFWYRDLSGALDFIRSDAENIHPLEFVSLVANDVPDYDEGPSV